MSLAKNIFLSSIILCISACQKTGKPETSTEVARIGIYAGSLSKNAEHAVIGSLYDGASLWRIDDNERLYNWNHTNETETILSSTDFSPKGRWALTSSMHDMVLWDIETGEGTRYWKAPAEILGVSLARNAGFALLGLSDSTAVMFDIQKGGILRTFTHGNRVRSVDLSEDGKIALSGSEDFTAKTWNTRTGDMLFQQQHEDDVQLVKLSDDGTLALSVSKYDSAKIWKTNDGELIGEIPLRAEHVKRGLRYTSARFSQDNAQLLTGRPDRRVELWQINNLELKAKWRLPKRSFWKPTSAAVLDLSFSKNTDEIKAISSDGFIHTLKITE